MKVKTTFLKRCLSWVMALALLVSSANLGWMVQAHAHELDDHPGKTFGELVAENYEQLTEAEENLLNSGYLAGDTVEYVVPKDSGLVTIDEENRKIEAAVFDDGHGNQWIPVSVAIMVGEAEEEKFDLTGEGNTREASYTYDGNAFSAKVKYELTVTVATEVQETLLNTGAWLKDGVANLDAVSGQSGNLYILEEALPALVEVAESGIAVGSNTIYLNNE